jgi:purine nucleosidase
MLSVIGMVPGTTGTTQQPITTSKGQISVATTADISGRPWRITEEHRVQLLTAQRQSVSRMVLDTDAFNEIDDQFALIYALLAPDLVNLEAIYAAPFQNARAADPAEGMRKSLDEIHRVLGFVPDRQVPAFAGSAQWMTAAGGPVTSAACSDLIERAQAGSSPLYVVAIGAPTNVASALLAEPEIARHIVVVWLGGNALGWRTAEEFNLRQDPAASRVLLDSGVPLVHVPCKGAADRLVTTRGEIDQQVRPAGQIGAMLAKLYDDFVPDEPGRSKVIWDLAAAAWVLRPGSLTTELTTSPVLTSEMTWSRDPQRHLVLEVTEVKRDEIFGDLFRRLRNAAGNID